MWNSNRFYEIAVKVNKSCNDHSVHKRNKSAQSRTHARRPSHRRGAAADGSMRRCVYEAVRVCAGCRHRTMSAHIVEVTLGVHDVLTVSRQRTWMAIVRQCPSGALLLYAIRTHVVQPDGCLRWAADAVYDRPLYIRCQRDTRRRDHGTDCGVSTRVPLWQPHAVARRLVHRGHDPSHEHDPAHVQRVNAFGGRRGRGDRTTCQARMPACGSVWACEWRSLAPTRFEASIASCAFACVRVCASRRRRMFRRVDTHFRAFGMGRVHHPDACPYLTYINFALKYIKFASIIIALKSIHRISSREEADFVFWQFHEVTGTYIEHDDNEYIGEYRRSE